MIRSWSAYRSTWRSVTARGRVTAVIAVLAALLALVTGWWEWLGIAAALGTLLLAAVAMALGSSSLSVHLDLPGGRVVVGDPATVTLQLQNSATGRMPALRMELVVAGVTVLVPVPSLAGGGDHQLRIPLPTYRRDVVDIGPVRAVHGDPFGLIRRVVEWAVQETLYVYPRTALPGSALPGVVLDLQGEESSVRTASDLAFHAVREYVPGDDRRFIHWKASARSGTLQVREFRQTQRSTVAVVLSANPGDYHLAQAPTSHRADGTTPDDEFEVAVGVAASISVELVRQRRDVVIDAAGLPIRGITAPALLDQFCSVDLVADLPDGETPGPASSIRQLGRAHPRLSLIVFVFGSTMSSAELRSVIRSCPAGAQLLAVRARAGSSPFPARMTGPAHGVVTVADVDDLPAALRAAM